MQVRMVWMTPNADGLVGYLARVSNTSAKPEDSSERLLAYLIRNQHWSPFEMVSACVEIFTTRDIARQMLRHRSFSFQEFSQRYSSVEELPTAAFRELRMRAQTDRQSSIEVRPGEQDELSADWVHVQVEALNACTRAYQWALDNGVAKEVARAVLPEGLTTTRLYMCGTLRSWIHYLQLRTNAHTQKEHRAIADAIKKLMVEYAPSIMTAVTSEGTR